MGNDLIKTEASGIMQLLHTNKEGLEALNPFSRDILLFETHVAGTTHIPDIEETVKGLKPDDTLDFFREPKNNYDEQAILVKLKDGAKIGYIPRNDNIVFARLMDAGKRLFGKVLNIEDKHGWIKITMEIYMHE